MIKRIFFFILTLFVFTNINAQWVYNFGGSSSDTPNNMAVDGSGNVYIIGNFQGSNIDFDPGTGTANLSSNGTTDIFVAKYNSSGEYQWAFNIGGTTGDNGISIAVDGSGNVYITGRFTGTNVDFDPGTGTHYLSSNGWDDIYFAKYNTNGEYQWAYSIGGSTYDFGLSIDVDGSGNVYITGNSQGTNVDFDPGAGTHYLSSNGNFDIFFAKYNSNGVYQWAYNIGGSADEGGYSINLDGSGNVYIAGYFQSSNVDFNPGAGTANLSSNGSNDIFFAKYNTNGAYQWAHSIGGSSAESVAGSALDGSGNVYITGYFSGSNIDFDPGTGTSYLSSNGSPSDIYFAKYNTNGEHQWAHSIGGSNGDSGERIDVDGSGNVYITGGFRESNVDFDPSIGTANLSSNGYHDIFFAKYNSSGEYQWAHSIGGSETDIGKGIAVDGSGDIYIAGYFQGTDIDFNPGSGTAYLSSNGSYDIYVGKYYTTDGSLPVELSFFKAIEGNQQVTLKWRTESELNNVSFFIERSTDNNEFEIIAEIDGQGTTSSWTEYEYIDNDLINETTYFYRLADLDYSGLKTYHRTIKATPKANILLNFALYNNYPNPFNSGTRIDYFIPHDSEVFLSINNILGQHIRTLYSGNHAKGLHSAFWNGKNDFGNDMNSGLYFCQLQSGKFKSTKKYYL
ncbi:SBBP repeat-containing protein [Calditrichota bacterium]